LLNICGKSIGAFLQLEYRAHSIERKQFTAYFPVLSCFRCPSPVLHERAGDIQGGDGEIRREREPTLERTRSAGESDILSLMQT